MMLLNYSTMSDSAVLFSSDDEESEAHHEINQYNSFKSMLKGVPPPSSITISKFTVDEMLQKYQEHKESFGFGITSDLNYSCSKKNPVPFLSYLNSSQMSESIASLVMKVQERYVQMETMSSCNIWFNATLQTCGSAKKRMQMRQRFGFSPGRRLSHLARRRQFFSSANLQRLANSVEVRQIEIKKNEHSQHKALNRSIPHEKLNSSKRALFLSPEEGTPVKYGNSVSVERKIYSSGSDDRKKLPLQERSKKVEVMRWLSQQNFDSDIPRKRLREECANHSDERKRKCPRRSLNFGDDDSAKARSSIATSESSSSTDRKTTSSVVKLSQNHKNKLLWAVSVVLKENNITRSDEKFKACASTLFHKCKKNFEEILRSEAGSGTSDKILMYAKKQIPEIFKSLNIPFFDKNQEDSKTGSHRDSVESSHFKNKLESKENINRNNCSDSTEVNLFKTPMKVRRKRIVKSCQKPSVEKRQKRGLRRWHSLESLIESYMKEMQDREENGNVKVCPSKDALNRELAEDSDKGSPCGTADETGAIDGVNCIPESPSTASELVENDTTPCKTAATLETQTPVMFSPVPSSVKESSDSPFVLFPALSQNKIESTSDVQIANQDKEMVAGIETLMPSTPENALPQLCHVDGNVKDFPGINVDEASHFEQSNTAECKESIAEEMENEGLETLIHDDNEKAAEADHGSCCGISEIVPIETPALSPGPVSVGASPEFSHISSSVVCAKEINEEGIECLEEAKAPETETLNEEANELINVPPNMISVENENMKEEEESSVDKDGCEQVTEDVAKESTTVPPDTSFGSACSVENETMETEATSNVDKVESEEETEEVVNTDSEVESPVLTCTYKPRKLVVKKSKPNWKVVRKNSEEAESECELRLKMRLSHEWEIVHRNSSCSEMANNSECEMSGLNCSQSSSVNGGRCSSSEVEQGNNSTRHSFEDNERDETSWRKRLDDTRLNSSVPEADVGNNTESNFDGCDDSYYKNNFCGDVLSSTINIYGDEQDKSLITTKKTGTGDGDEHVESCNGGVDESVAVTKENVGKNTISECAIKDVVDLTLDEGRESPILLPALHSDRRSRERSNSAKKSNLGENLVEEIVRNKRRREDDDGGDSESNSSSCGPQRKKRVLSLEKYKARKSEEAPSEAKSRTPPSSEWSESGETSVEEVTNSAKKIYNITLKRPGDRRSRKKYKHREKVKVRVSRTSGERHSEHSDGDRSREGRRSDPRLNRSSDSAGMPQSKQDTEVSETENVKVQTIVNALSALSNLVEKQIKMEEEKLELRRSSGGESDCHSTEKDGKWMDVVSTWCGNYLSSASATGPVQGGSGSGMKPAEGMRRGDGRPHQSASAGKTVGTWELAGNGSGTLGYHDGHTSREFGFGTTPRSWESAGCGSASLTSGNVQICRNPSMEHNLGGVVDSTQERRRVREGVGDDHARGVTQIGLNCSNAFMSQNVQSESFTLGYPSVSYQQSGYPLSNDYTSVWKPYYQPTLQPIYNNCGTWQFPTGGNDWSYQQNSDSYQTPNYFAYQMPDVKYYYNNF